MDTDAGVHFVLASLYLHLGPFPLTHSISSVTISRKTAKKVVVEELGDPYASREVYFDHVDSLIFCQM